METQNNKNIYQRVHGVMKDVDYIQKGDARVNGQYRFVSHDQVSAKLHPYLVKHGIVVIPTVETIKQDGNLTEVHLVVLFQNIDDVKDAFTVRTVGYGISSNKDGKLDDKGPGKAMSYAYKYALLKTFCLETGEDPDNDANAYHEPSKCLEWQETLVGWPIEVKKVEGFIKECAEASGKHPEDIKRAALKNMDKFVDGFNKWTKKQKG